MTNKIPFKDVPIGSKIKFPGNSTTYTRVEPEGKKGRELGIPRTLTFQEGDRIRDAYCPENCADFVTVLEFPKQ